MRRIVFGFALLLAFWIFAFAQNTNSHATTNRSISATPTKSRPRTAVKPRPRTTATQAPSPKPSPSKPAAQANANKAPAKPAATPAPASDGVLAAFNKIIDGIRKANVDLVMNGYLKDPSLVFFNYNGTATRGWEQMRKNREGSYPEMKDVKLDVRDVHVQTLGRDGAVVTCLWTQTQTYKGAPDTASGRMTLVFKRVGTEWKAVHLHTSPDRPDPSRVPASEQTPSPSTKP